MQQLLQHCWLPQMLLRELFGVRQMSVWLDVLGTLQVSRPPSDREPIHASCHILHRWLLPPQRIRHLRVLHWHLLDKQQGILPHDSGPDRRRIVCLLVIRVPFWNEPVIPRIVRHKPRLHKRIWLIHSPYIVARFHTRRLAFIWDPVVFSRDYDIISPLSVVLEIGLTLPSSVRLSPFFGAPVVPFSSTGVNPMGPSARPGCRQDQGRCSPAAGGWGRGFANARCGHRSDGQGVACCEGPLRGAKRRPCGTRHTRSRRTGRDRRRRR
jgi:hypothetical protein